MPDKTPLSELKAKALETAHRFDVYSSYGGNEATAVRALLRRVQGYEKKDVRRWFLKALAVQRDIRPWLHENRDAVHAVYEEQRTFDFGDVAKSFHDTHKGWPKGALTTLLGWSYVYYYLR